MYHGSGTAVTGVVLFHDTTAVWRMFHDTVPPTSQAYLTSNIYLAEYAIIMLLHVTLVSVLPVVVTPSFRSVKT